MWKKIDKEVVEDVKMEKKVGELRRENKWFIICLVAEHRDVNEMAVWQEKKSQFK